MTQVTATEALSLLLMQFGSTFEFIPDRAAIRIVPIPSRVFVERSYTLPPNATETVRAGKEKFAGAEIIVEGAKLIVQATVEQQAEIVRHAFLLRRGAAVIGAPDLARYESILPFGR